MVRKSKQASGNAALTHYEMRHKLTGEHGTQERRLAGHSQYRLGDCGLSLTPLVDASTVLCSPSGYLYEDQAILQYLVTQTQLLKEQREKAQAQQKATTNDDNDQTDDLGKRKAAFDASQKDWVKKQKPNVQLADATIQAAKQDLKRTSYWLADSQPVLETTHVAAPENVRPLSPHSQQPLRRKDLWPLELEYSNGNATTFNNNNNQRQLLCSLTGKPIRTQAAIAYWTSRDEPGKIVLKEEGYQQLIVGSSSSGSNSKTKPTTTKKNPKIYCPNTHQKIKYTRELQRSGSSFATSGQATVVQKYKPTMT